MSEGDIRELYRTPSRRWLQHWLDGPTLPGNPLRRGDLAPDLELIAEDGSAVRLSSHWAERPALVILWRHLGCGCGLERAEQLQRDYPRVPRRRARGRGGGPRGPGAGGRLQGEVRGPGAHARRWRLLHPYGPSGWATGPGNRSSTTLRTTSAIWRRRPASPSRNRAARWGGHWWTTPGCRPGEFVVGTDGVIRVAYPYNYCEDYPDPRIFTTAARLAV